MPQSFLRSKLNGLFLWSSTIEILKPVIEKAVQDAMERNIPVTPNALKAIEPWIVTKPASRARN
jgi:hypothetical protein